MNSPEYSPGVATGLRIATGLANWFPSQKLLVIGVGPQTADLLAQQYRLLDRPLPLIRACARPMTALQLLAEETFDEIIVAHSTSPVLEGGVDALAVCHALRAAGCQDAVLVVTTAASPTLWQAVADTDSEIYVGPAFWNTSLALTLIDRTLRRHRLYRDQQRRDWDVAQQVNREREACSEIVRQQRQSAAANTGLAREHASVQHHSSGPGSCGLGSSGLNGPGHGGPVVLPPELPTVYRELLRAYVMTASCQAIDFQQLARTFTLARLSPRQVWSLHLDQVEQLMRGIGQRSARHIIDRANSFCLELMVQFCEAQAQENTQTWWAWRRQSVSDAGVSLENHLA